MKPLLHVKPSHDVNSSQDKKEVVIESEFVSDYEGDSERESVGRDYDDRRSNKRRRQDQSSYLTLMRFSCFDVANVMRSTESVTMYVRPN